MTTDVLVVVIVVLLVALMTGFVVAARRMPLGRSGRGSIEKRSPTSEALPRQRGAQQSGTTATRPGRRYGPQAGRRGRPAPTPIVPEPPDGELPVLEAPPEAALAEPEEQVVAEQVLEEQALEEVIGAEPPEDVERAPATLEQAAEPEAPLPASFRDRLSRTREALAGSIGGLRGRRQLDERSLEDVEEALILADVGLPTTTRLLDELRERQRTGDLRAGGDLTGELKSVVAEIFEGEDRSLRLEPGTTNVWLFVGVNGAGKTTTIGKLAAREAAAGHRVVLGAGDTFRAAAADQLELWAERAGASIVRGAEGADPSSVIFDAVQHAAARQADLVLADSAGRLHTKVNLMEELRKVRRVADRPPGNVTEVLLVLDATTGQNGLVQARQFTEAVGVTGVVLTKLDGTAKGGIAIAIRSELGLPIKLVGLGEGAGDLVEFDPEEFAEALFGYDD